MFLLAIIIIIAVVYFAAKPNRHFGCGTARTNDAEELLKKRFVSGEIDEEAYKKMLQALRS